ncbi:hypothetical protein [Simplicispira suum]|uniref:hypothetical protein n=1 Tax=Simplicispira suum TaxID=2109915 RepID=UPI003B8473EB
MSLIPMFTALDCGPTLLMLQDADGGHLCFSPQVETLASALRPLAPPWVLH